MPRDRARCLSLQVSVPNIVHQRRIERRRVHGARDAAGKDHGGGRQIVDEDDALRQVALDQVVACAEIRVVPLTKSSRPSCRKSGSEGFSASRATTSSGSSVPSSLE